VTSTSKRGIVWFELHVTDAERARSFYSTLFGWEFRPHHSEAEDNEAWTIDAGEAIGGTLIRTDDMKLRGGGTCIYAHVEELQSSVDQALGLGATLERAPMRINDSDGRTALIRDPDSNVIGLWSP